MLAQGSSIILSERAFAEALRLERKRTRRSTMTASMLMMLRFDEHVESPRKTLASLVAPGVTSGIRVADFIGWYERDVSLGVVFTGIYERLIPKAFHAIECRVRTLLCSTLPTQYLEHLNITCVPIELAQSAVASQCASTEAERGGKRLQSHEARSGTAYHIHVVSPHPQESGKITSLNSEGVALDAPYSEVKPLRRTLVSIVVPVYNEEDGIAQLDQRLANIAALWSDTFDLEFVFVNDGSSDETQRHLQNVFGSRPSVRLAVHEHNRGIGAAFRTGFDNCKGSIICTIDADCSYGPENLERLVSALEEHAADIAVASPYHPLGEVDGVPRWRVLLSKSCSFLYWVIAPVRLYTYTSVFRAYRRDALDKLRFERDGFVSAAEILVRAAESGSTIVEVPMTLRARTIGYTKMRILRTIIGHLSLIGSLAVYRLQSVKLRRGNLHRRSAPRVSMSAD